MIEPLRLSAPWLLRPGRPPVRNGSVIVGENGRIEWVGPEAEAPTGERLRQQTFPDGMLAPGMVNVHTHLELTHLAGLVTETSFPRWLRTIRDLKDRTDLETFDAAVAIGMHQMWGQGVTTVGDVGSTGRPPGILSALGARGIYYHETFGPHPDHVDASATQLAFDLERLSSFESTRLSIGVSPHAPYTVSAALMRAAFAEAARGDRPVTIHVAESPDELTFIRDGEGPFARWHRDRDIPVAPRGRSTIGWLDELGVLEQSPLCVHCVTVDDEDIECMARRHVTVAHCPLSNRAHRHGAAPVEAMRREGLALGLGTDSVVSQEPLDLRAEALATDLSPDARLQLLTMDGARALGMTNIGDLDVGFWGDVVVFGLPKVWSPDGWDRASVQATFVGGRCVYDANTPLAKKYVEWTRIVDNARARLRT